MPLIEIDNLSVEFMLPSGPISAVDGASFLIPAGGTVALVGESGSGKTVVSQSILRLLPKTATITGGRIMFRDPRGTGEVRDLARMLPDAESLRAIRGGRIGIIFQEPMTALSPVHTVGDQVGEVLTLHRGVRGPAAAELVRDTLRLVGFPDPMRAYRAYPFELSGGLRQRAMIAMALVCRPALLIADEPTTALDVTVQAQILKLLKDLQAELGMAVLMITHDLGVVANMARDLVVMYQGRVVERGTLAELFEAPRHPYLQALMRAVPRLDTPFGTKLVPIREIKRAAGALQGPPELAMVLGTGDGGAPRGTPLLEVRGLAKAYAAPRKASLFRFKAAPPARAVDAVDLTVLRGECLGLVGESGCGKTTLSKLILRALSPDAGTVTYFGKDGPIDVLALQGEALKVWRREVQFVFQDPFSSLNPRMTVEELVAEPLVIHELGTPEVRRVWVEELLSNVGIDPRHRSRYPHSFSGGQRQRIGIARALALKPRLLLCDEPVSALDVSIQAQIMNLLRDLKDELGLTYLFVSHNLAVVRYLADRIAVMCRGRIVEVATREQLFSAPRHPYTQALLAAVPDPNPAVGLDFAKLMEGRASEPTAWPQPYTCAPDQVPNLVEVAPGHAVRMAA